MAEALGFTVAVAIYIWFIRAQWPWIIFVLAALAMASFIRHSETLDSLGLTVGAFLNAMAEWRWWLAAGIAAVVILGWMRVTPGQLVNRWLLYLFWCILQQLLFQNMIYRRLRAALGASWGTRVCAGALFAAVHMPNPILVPATFLWGTVSTRLFDSHPSIPSLGLWQALLSILLTWLAPITMIRQLRVGPGYWTW